MGQAASRSHPAHHEAGALPSWDEAAARLAEAQAPDPLLGRFVYVSRLLGGQPSLALHGGGNTSVKSTFAGLGGEAVAALWVKGSGVDLAAASEGSFAPADLERLRRLLACEQLGDREMARELRSALLDPDARALQRPLRVHDGRADPRRRRRRPRDLSSADRPDSRAIAAEHGGHPQPVVVPQLSHR